MTDRVAIHREIKNLTIFLVDKSISINQNFPRYSNNELVWENFKNIAFTLKNESYERIYKTCVEEKDYNIMLLDGGLLQLKYQFRKNKIVAHILSFYPNPDFEKFQDNPEEFEELYFGNELFTDILDKKAIIFPIRFDFSNVHTDVIHPKVHCTFGNYKDCRIPITKPISPKRFVSFILRNFYSFKFFEDNLEDKLVSNLSFTEQTTADEKKIIHLTYE